MKAVKCPICGKEVTRNDLAVNNHIRLTHPEITTRGRTKIRMQIFGDMRAEHKLRKQNGTTHEERARAKIGGIKS